MKQLTTTKPTPAQSTRQSAAPALP